MKGSTTHRPASFCLSVLLGVACSSDPTTSAATQPADDAGAGDARTEEQPDPACPVVVPDSECDTSQRPIVFVHGNFGSGDNIMNAALLMASNGYCMNRFYAIDYNSLDPAEQQPGLDGRLDQLIDQALADTGAEQVDLMGHSNGTINIRSYLLEGGQGPLVPEHAAKVAHYIHLAGGPLPVPSEVPTLCVASNSDATATGLCPEAAAETFVFEEYDHIGVATSDETFVAIHRFLRGEDPTHTSIQCGSETLTLEGKVETFADNQVPVGLTAEIHEIGSDPRDRGAPAQTLTVGPDGTVGPWTVKRHGHYEYKAIDAQGHVIGRQYLPPPKRDNKLLRFLVPSTALALVTDSIVRSEGHAALIARSYKGAFRKDLGDNLSVDGAEVLIDELATAQSATWGLFMFDDNMNGISDGGSLAAYAGLPFIRGTDVFMDASVPRFMQIEFNGSVMQIPNWPSASEGPILVYFP